MPVNSQGFLRSAPFVLLSVALTLAAAGCGGSSGKSTTTVATTARAAAPVAAGPSKAEFVAKANAICNATNGPLTATALTLATTHNPAAAEQIVTGKFIPEIESQAGQIKALGTPTEGQATIASMDKLLAGDIGKIAKDPALAGPAAFHDFAQVAHGYGLTACAPLS
jgi:hypothetical protein